MNRHVRTAVSLAAALLGAGALAACGSSTPHGIPANAVAAVEGHGVTEAEVNHWILVAVLKNSTGVLEKGAVAPDPPTYEACIHHLEEVAKVAAPGHPPKRENLKKACEEQYKTLHERALAFLITAQWAFAEARRLGIEVSDAEVQKAYETLKAKAFPTEAQEQALFKKTGETKADVLLQVKLNLINEAISKHAVGGKVQVSDQQIESYYRQHPSQFAATETRDVRLILVSTKAAAEAIKKEIQAGKDAAAIANAKTLEQSGRGTGGVFSNVVRGEHPPALDRAIFAAPVNVVGGPVKVLAGYYVYEVLAVHRNPTKTLAQSRAAIKAQLSQPQEEAVLKRFASEFEKRWTQQTECRPGSVVAQCKKAQSTSKEGQ